MFYALLSRGSKSFCLFVAIACLGLYATKAKAQNSPDLALQVLRLDTTTTTPSGQFKATLTVTNVGKAASPRVVLGIYLATTSQISIYHRSLYTDTIPPIAAGASDSRTVTLTIPGFLAPGAYYISSRIDVTSRILEANEQNNDRVLAFTVKADTTRPDLQVTNLQLSTNGVSQGGRITLRYTVANRGSSTASNINLGFYVSDNSLLDPAADRNIGQQTLRSLTAKSTSTGSIVLTLPKAVSAGFWFLGVYVDDKRQVSESNERNNTAATSIRVAANPSFADLIVTGLNVRPQSATQGGRLSITISVRNIGRSDAPASTVGLYYSDNFQISPQFDVRVGILKLGVVKAGGSASGTAVVYLPPDALPGTRYLGAFADDLLQVPESNENNNSNAVSLQVSAVPLPDLHVTASSASPSRINAGQTLVLQLTVTNQGKGRAVRPTQLAIRYSPNSVISSTDIILLTKQVPALDPGKSWTGTLSFPLTTMAAPGTRYLGLVVDHKQEIAESDETNNTKAQAITVNTVPLPAADLLCSQVVLLPSVLDPGRPLTLTATIHNKGNKQAGTFTVGFYLSRNQTISTNDTFLGKVSVTKLAAGSSTTLSWKGILPSFLPTGPLTLGVIVDHDGQIPEQDKGNNTRTVLFVVRPPPKTAPDLTVTTFTLNQSQVSAGSSCQALLSIKNSGQRSAGPFRGVIALAPPPNTPNAPPLPLADFTQTQLNAGQSATQTVLVPIPPNAPVGRATLLLTLDPDGKVVESDRQNNETKATLTIQSDNRPNLQVRSLTLNRTSIPAGDGVTVQFTLGNQGQSNAVQPKVSVLYLAQQQSGKGTTLGSRTIPFVLLGGTQKSTLSVTIPRNAQTGTRYLKLLIDPDNAINETDEFDNERVVAFAVLKAGACSNGTQRPCYTSSTGCTKQSDGSFRCQGSCRAGTQRCQNNAWGRCQGQRSPSMEACDNTDNDCDGKIDNNKGQSTPLTQSCRNSCGQGTERCSQGQWRGCDAPQPKPEVCDNTDNDCDGKIDNNKGQSTPLVRPCKSACAQGTETCIRGRYQGCTATTQCEPKREPAREVRREAPREAQKERASVDAGASDAGTPEASSTERQSEQTRDAASCYTQGCPAGQRCQEGHCEADPCAQANCNTGTFCREGQCIDACGCLRCGNNQRCVDGRCEVDPCAQANCKSGEWCDPSRGRCLKDPCTSVQCGLGRRCLQGRCFDDPCVSIQCPSTMICRDGQCIGQRCDERNDETTPETTTTESTQDAGTNLDRVANTEVKSTDDRPREVASETTRPELDQASDDTAPELHSETERSGSDQGGKESLAPQGDRPPPVLPKDTSGWGCQMQHSPLTIPMFFLLLLILGLRRRRAPNPRI